MTKRCLRLLQLALVGIPVTVAAPWAISQSLKAFDVISVKSDRDGHGLDAGAQPGGRYTARNVSAEFLLTLLTEAFDVKDYQIFGKPKWADEDHYDIIAKVETTSQLNHEQLKPLLQAMLVDRFKLRYQTEMKQFPAYSLVVGKGGPKFKADNNILVSPSLKISINNGRATMTARQMAISALATQLVDMTGRGVIDD